MLSSPPKINLKLHRRQSIAFSSGATEQLYGGAAGGGKSHLMRVLAIAYCIAVPGLQVYLFRRVSSDLQKNHMEGPSSFPKILADWVNSGHCEITKHYISFSNGSKIHLCHCKDPAHVFKYNGAEIHLLLIDEVTFFTFEMYTFLRGRVRLAGLNVPPSFKERLPKIVCSGNPIGPGMGWVKQMFIDPKPANEIWRTSKDEGYMLRQYIPARIEDNPTLEIDDPNYRYKLRGMYSQEVAKALENGDWNVSIGSYFKTFGNQHIIKPFFVPEHWLKFTSFDWGYSKPFSFGWYTVADGTPTTDAWGQERTFTPGCLIKYREWYGIATRPDGSPIPDVGAEIDNIDIIRGIKAREPVNEKISYRLSDSLVFQARGGPKISELFEEHGIILQRGDDSRVSGWTQVRDRLNGFDGNPMLLITDNCRHTIRTGSILQTDDKNPNDVDTRCEDHAWDELRLAAMSRPWVAPVPKPTKSIEQLNKMTIDDLLKASQGSGKRARI